MKIDGTLRCPFCGGEDLQHRVPTSPHGQMRAIHCNGCGADGPAGYGHEQAREGWNRRPNKPVRTLSAAGSCTVCAVVTEDHCCDCMMVLCLRLECDRKHATACEPIQRALRTLTAKP